MTLTGSLPPTADALRAVVQRVRSASVTVEDQLIGSIKHGLLVLVGIGRRDNEENATRLAHKICSLRIFADDTGKMGLSVKDVSGQLLAVSQFTLFSDVGKGNRPSFLEAADPSKASPLFDRFVDEAAGTGVEVLSGVFGAHMQVELINDGPVTIILDI